MLSHLLMGDIGFACSNSLAYVWIHHCMQLICIVQSVSLWNYMNKYMNIYIYFCYALMKVHLGKKFCLNISSVVWTWS